MRGKPILCVDFDGVIHSYASGWKGATVIPDPPVPGALKWLWAATEWFNVQVYSSRSKEPLAVEAMQLWLRTHATKELGAEHPMAWEPGPAHPITFAHEKPAAFLTIDDRAICFDGDWSEIDPADLLNFQPWNKRHTPVGEAVVPHPPLNADNTPGTNTKSPLSQEGET